MSRCIVCGKELSDSKVLSLDNMPSSAQNIPTAAELGQDQGISLDLCQCKCCGLVQFDCEPVSYYKDVIRAVGTTDTMVRLRRKQFDHLINTYHLQNKKIIEVGCGNGDFLKLLSEFPVRAYGMEHGLDVGNEIESNNIIITKNFPDNPNENWTFGPFDAFLSFNFLEHQPSPNVMLQAIYHNLTEDGVGLITVPSLEYILTNAGYYELIRDHIAYYTFESLNYLLQKNGFTVLEQEVINRDTISVIVKKKKHPDISSLIQGHEAIVHEVNQFVESIKKRKETLAIWGAGHQGFTLSATTLLRENAVFIADSAVFKQRKFAPASHLPIVPPDRLLTEGVDNILIIAPGYSDEIYKVIRDRLRLECAVYTMRSRSIERMM